MFMFKESNRKLISLFLTLAIVIGSFSGYLFGGNSVKADDMSDKVETIIEFGSDGWTYKKNIREGTLTENGYPTDETWTTGAKMPLGFGGGGIPARIANGTQVPNDPRDCYSILVQKTITIDDVNNYFGFLASAIVDDAAVLFVNGKEAALFHAMEGTPGESDVSLGYRKVSVVNDPFDDGQKAKSHHNDIHVARELFVDGENTITLLMLNDRKDSSDIFADLEIKGIINEPVVDFGSDGWAYKKNIIEGTVPEGGFTIDDSWTTDAKFPMGYAGSSSTITSVLNEENGTVVPKDDGALSIIAQKTVTINDLSRFSGFLASAVVDDAAVLFVNGKEAALFHAKAQESGDNVALGYTKSAVVDDPFSESQRSKSTYTNIPVSSSLFVEGENTITFLILNDRKSSSDIFGNFKLIGKPRGANDPHPDDPTPVGTSIQKGDEWLWLKNGSGSEWLKEDFVPTFEWTLSSAPIGYGYPDVDNVPKGDCANVYARRYLLIEDMSKVKTVVINLEVDDRATVYFNGVQAHPTFNEGGVVDKDPFNTGDLRLFPNGLKEGLNVISVNIINDRPGSSDLFFDMSLETSEEEMGFLGDKFVMTPGKNPSEMGFAWFTPYVRGENSIYFVPNTADEQTYSVQLQGQINSAGGRFHDGNNKSIYKLPLGDEGKATLIIDISQNYTIELSGDGQNWGDVIADPALKDVGETGNQNREKKIFDMKPYIYDGYEYIYVRVGDQTTGNGWGGIVWNIEMVYGDFPPAAAAGAAIQIAKKSEMNGMEFPESARIIDAESKIVDSYFSNQVTVTGLENNTEYAYRFGNKEEDQWSLVYTFMTQDPDKQPYTAIFIADAQIGASGNATVDGQNWNITLNKATQLVPHASFILSAGDQVDNDNREIQYEYLLNNDVLKKYPFVPTSGNHDANNPSFSHHYNMPNLTGLGKTGATSDYYFSYGNTLYIVLNGNNENVAEHKQAIEMAQASHPDAKWNIVIIHQDIYGSGKHATSPANVSTATVRLRQSLAPILEEKNIDIVLAGHDHTHSRSHIMKNQMPQLDTPIDDNGSYVAPDGVLYITASTASGCKYYDPVLPQTWLAKSIDLKVPQFSVIEISDGEFRLRTYRSDTMEMIDEVGIRKAVSKQELEALADVAEDKDESEYTQESYAALAAALAQAKSVLGKTDATQDEINSAYAALNKALSELVSISGIRSNLAELIDEAETLHSESKAGDKDGEYPQSAMDALKNAINAAKAVLNDGDADENDLQAAIDALNNAIETFKDQVITKTSPGTEIPPTGDRDMAVHVVLIGTFASAIVLLAKKKKKSSSPSK